MAAGVRLLNAHTHKSSKQKLLYFITQSLYNYPIQGASMAKEYGLTEAAKLVNRNPSFLRSEVLKNKLKARKLGGSWIVKHGDLLAWYQALDKRLKPGAVPLDIGAD
jgi:hypothetical protein